MSSRLSLRALLLSFIVLGVVFGQLARELRVVNPSIEQERRFSALVKDLGGEVRWDTNANPGYRFFTNLSDTQVLHSVSISSKPGDSSWSPDEQAMFVSQISKLNHLLSFKSEGDTLAYSAFDKRELLPKSLLFARFNEGQWTEESIYHAIRDSHKIRSLSIGYNQNIDDISALNLEEFPSLETLSLRHTKASDDDMPAISQLSQLRRIFLSGTDITDEAIVHLLAMENLRECHLIDNPGVSVQGRERLRARGILVPKWGIE